MVLAAQRQSDLADMLTYKSREPEKLANADDSDAKRLLGQTEGWECSGPSLEIPVPSTAVKALPLHWAKAETAPTCQRPTPSCSTLNAPPQPPKETSPSMTCWKNAARWRFSLIDLDLGIGEVKAEGRVHSWKRQGGVRGPGQRPFLDPKRRKSSATGQLTVRADSGFYAHAIVAVCRDKDVRFSITVRSTPAQPDRRHTRGGLDAHPLLDGGRRRRGGNHVCTLREQARTLATVRLIVRRVKPTPVALFANYSYHAFITDRDGDTLYLEADHRRHAEIENAIRDLKYGVGLNHLPSGRFPANAAWLAVQVIPTIWLAGRAHRPGRATGNHQDPPAALLLAGRTAHPLGPASHPASAPGLALAEPVQSALARLRALPLPS